MHYWRTSISSADPVARFWACWTRSAWWCRPVFVCIFVLGLSAARLLRSPAVQGRQRAPKSWFLVWVGTLSQSKPIGDASSQLQAVKTILSLCSDRLLIVLSGACSLARAAESDCSQAFLSYWPVSVHGQQPFVEKVLLGRVSLSASQGSTSRVSCHFLCWTSGFSRYSIFTNLGAF